MGSINVGEAAHIYGANPGSARYAKDMASSDRSAISNAIWLCGNCHKIVDDDELRYPAGLLFEWQRDHERWVAEQVGRAGAELRRKYEERHLEEFGKLSYPAERMIIEKGDLWEYRLTAEVLRFEMAPILQRWDALKRGLYVKSMRRITKDEFVPWMQTKIREIQAITRACNGLMNGEFQRAWGEPGIPGVDTEIVKTCKLYSEVCESVISWEEDVRFAHSPNVCENIQNLFIGVGGIILEEAARLPKFFSEILGSENPSGTHHFTLVLELPDGWAESVEVAFERAAEVWNSDEVGYD